MKWNEINGLLLLALWWICYRNFRFIILKSFLSAFDTLYYANHLVALFVVINYFNYSGGSLAANKTAFICFEAYEHTESNVVSALFVKVNTFQVQRNISGSRNIPTCSLTYSTNWMQDWKVHASQNKNRTHVHLRFWLLASIVCSGII